MPSANQSRSVDMSRLRAKPTPPTRVWNPPPPMGELPHYMTQSPVMIGSLPPLGTTPVDSALRQFYGTNLPVRRVLLP